MGPEAAQASCQVSLFIVQNKGITEPFRFEVLHPLVKTECVHITSYCSQMIYSWEQRWKYSLQELPILPYLPLKSVFENDSAVPLFLLS